MFNIEEDKEVNLTNIIVNERLIEILEETREIINKEIFLNKVNVKDIIKYMDWFYSLHIEQEKIRHQYLKYEKEICKYIKKANQKQPNLYAFGIAVIIEKDKDLLEKGWLGMFDSEEKIVIKDIVSITELYNELSENEKQEIQLEIQKRKELNEKICFATLLINYIEQKYKSLKKKEGYEVSNHQNRYNCICSQLINNLNIITLENNRYVLTGSVCVKKKFIISEEVEKKIKYLVSFENEIKKQSDEKEIKKKEQKRIKMEMKKQKEKERMERIERKEKEKMEMIEQFEKNRMEMIKQKEKMIEQEKSNREKYIQDVLKRKKEQINKISPFLYERKLKEALYIYLEKQLNELK